MNDRPALLRASVALVLGCAMFATAACGDDDDDDDNNGAPGLSVTLDSYSIQLSNATVPAGAVEIEAKNAAGEAHELVVIRTDLAADALPVESDKVVEDDVDVIGEIEEFGGGTTESGTFTLESGKYVLICNIPAHYGLGMHAALTVE